LNVVSTTFRLNRSFFDFAGGFKLQTDMLCAKLVFNSSSRLALPFSPTLNPVLQILYLRETRRQTHFLIDRLAFQPRPSRPPPIFMP
jgi:hypothetical protein